MYTYYKSKDALNYDALLWRHRLQYISRFQQCKNVKKICFRLSEMQYFPFYVFIGVTGLYMIKISKPKKALPINIK